MLKEEEGIYTADLLMRQSPFFRQLKVTRCLRLGPSGTSTGATPSAEQLQQKIKEAEERGFARRDGVGDAALLESTLKSPTIISGSVSVSNLPEVPRKKTEFDDYQLSTTDFTSLVTAHGAPVSSALGAGFGAKEDKRLGFLRPRKPLQPYSGTTPLMPKYDENGMPIDLSLSREQLMEKRREYLKSFEGTTLSAREHFLLVDLDFQKDSMLFGNTREEFEKNVTKLKNVIITYNKWERADNFYYYTTVLLRILTLWLVMEGVQQYYELRLLELNFNTFAEVMETEIAALDAARVDDLKRAAVEIQTNKPDFSPAIQTIKKEMERVEEVAAEATKGNTSKAESAKGGIGGLLWEAVQVNVGKGAATSTSPAESQQLNALALKAPGTPHPMDTTKEEQMMEKQRRDAAMHELQRLHDLRNTAVEPGVGGALLSRLGRLLRFTPTLTSTDVAKYSYAASPTSITSMRLLRRILLPRTEDYTQIVRESMVEYRRNKDAAMSSAQ